MNLVQVGQRVRQALKDEGVSQVEFAEIGGTSNGFISEVCRGKKRPSVKVLETLSDKYGYSIRWILTGEGDKKDRFTSGEGHAGQGKSPERWVSIYGSHEEAEEHFPDTMRNIMRSIWPHWVRIEAARLKVSPEVYQEMHGLVDQVLERMPTEEAAGGVRTVLRGLISTIPDRSTPVASKE